MRCTVCRKNKSKSGFYNNPRMANGCLNQCKECVKSRVRARRAANINQYRAKDNARNMRSDRVKARKVYVTTEAGKTSRNRTTNKWLASNPDKRKAHIVVSNALRSGKLVKKPCYRCSVTRVQAHHKDYNKPLDVIWCCARHHKDFHR